MRTLVALALLAAAAAAEVRAPLGPWARPGVPVLLTSDGPSVVEIDGWRWRVDGPTLVHPPRLPAVVRDEEGVELLRLEPVKAGMWLVGVAGDPPAGLSDVLPDVKVVAADPRSMKDARWPLGDVFDVVLDLRTDGDRGAFGGLWHLAGGHVAVLDATTQDSREGRLGLGSYRRVARAEDALRSPPTPRIPRPGNVRPDLYDLVWPAEGSPGPLRSAVWIVAGAAVAVALQILLAATGRMTARILVFGLGAVALLGSVLGLLRPRAEYDPVAEGRIEVVYRDGEATRVRSYRVFSWAGPGASVVAPAGATPILYREGSPPWWEGPDRRCRLEEGVVRIFLAEDLGTRPGERRGEEADTALARTASREHPGGAWEQTLERLARSPAPPPKGPVLLARITFVAQD